VEPSSMRSLIQLAGRVRRHRPGAVSAVNMQVLDSNLRHYERERPGEAVFCWPGFEMDKINKPTPGDTAAHFHLERHDLTSLLELPKSGIFPIDARPRISAAKALNPKHRLVDLEHARMEDTMLPPQQETSKTLVKRNATLHWDGDRHLWLTGLLPQYQRFRDNSTPQVDVAWLPNEDNRLVLHEVMDEPHKKGTLYVPAEARLKREDIRMGPRMGPWLQVDLLDELAALADSRGMPLRQCAENFAVVSLPKPDDHLGWRHHDFLGFTKRKK